MELPRALRLCRSPAVAMICPVKRLPLLAFGALLLACGSTPERLPVVSTELRIVGEPLVQVHVRIASDMRPMDEHGTFKALGQHQLQHRRFAVPTLVEVADTVARDLVRSGVALEASLIVLDAPYLLELDILHLGTEISGGLESLFVLAPTCSLKATCELRWRLLDRHGRCFLNTTTTAMLGGSASPLGGLETEAARLLGRALRSACDEGLPRLLPAIDAWWQAEGFPPRREPLVNPLPVPRSSTDR